jgi:hypothetical protein
MVQCSKLSVIYLHPLYGEQDDLIVNPRILRVKHFFLENFRGRLNTFLSVLRRHFFEVFV